MCKDCEKTVLKVIDRSIEQGFWNKEIYIHVIQKYDDKFHKFLKSGSGSSKTPKMKESPLIFPDVDYFIKCENFYVFETHSFDGTDEVIQVTEDTYVPEELKWIREFSKISGGIYSNWLSRMRLRNQLPGLKFGKLLKLNVSRNHFEDQLIKRFTIEDSKFKYIFYVGKLNNPDKLTVEEGAKSRREKDEERRQFFEELWNDQNTIDLGEIKTD